MGVEQVLQSLTRYFTREGYGTKGRVAAWLSYTTVVIPIFAGLALASVSVGRKIAHVFSNQTGSKTKTGTIVEPILRQNKTDLLSQLLIVSGSEMPKMVLILPPNELDVEPECNKYVGILNKITDDVCTLSVTQCENSTTSVRVKLKNTDLQAAKILIPLSANVQLPPLPPNVEKADEYQDPYLEISIDENYSVTYHQKMGTYTVILLSSSNMFSLEVTPTKVTVQQSEND